MIVTFVPKSSSWKLQAQFEPYFRDSKGLFYRYRSSIAHNAKCARRKLYDSLGHLMSASSAISVVDNLNMYTVGNGSYEYFQNTVKPEQHIKNCNIICPNSLILFHKVSFVLRGNNYAASFVVSSVWKLKPDQIINAKLSSILARVLLLAHLQRSTLRSTETPGLHLTK